MDYKKWIRSLDQPQDQDPGNPTITFREECCSNQTHVSTTNPDAKLANKWNGTVAMGGDTVNELMENRYQLLLGINVESFRCPASERKGGRDLIDACHHLHGRHTHTVGEDNEYVPKPFLTALFLRRIRPHIAAKTTGQEPVHQRMRRMSWMTGYLMSKRARTKIEVALGTKRTTDTDFVAFSGVDCGKSERRGLSNGMAAECEAAGEIIARSGLGGE